MILQRGEIMRRKYSFALIILLFVLVTCPVKVSAFNLIPVTRLYGEDRYSTSVEISKCGWKKSSINAVIATGEDFPDALCAAPLAGRLNSPVLLTGRFGLDNDVKSELIRLGTRKVILIGGEGAISADVEKELTALGIESERIFGTDRYQTSVKIAEYMAGNFKLSGEIAVATGENFPDALSVAPIAASKGMPVILVPDKALPEAVKSYIKEHDVDKAYVIGGESIVGERILEYLPSPERIYGNDRYETNLRILQRFSKELDCSTVYIATGKSFPDALSGSALASVTCSPVILVEKASSDIIKGFMDSKLNIVKAINVLGGEGAVPVSIVNKICPHIVSIDDIKITVNKGESFSLPQKVRAYISDGNIREESVAWSPGTADASREGTYTFEGTVSGYSRKVFLTLTVTIPSKINSILGVGDTLTLVSNKSLQLSPVAVDTSGKEIKNARFTFSSSKPGVVEISSSGLIKGISQGMAILTIKAQNTINEMSVNTIAIVSDKLALTDIARESSSVVYIEVYDEKHMYLGYGSGFIVSPEGKVLTNYHVIDNARYATVTLENGTKYEVEGVLNYDAKKDIAILKLKNSGILKAVRLGNSDSLKVGSEIVAIGSPMGYKNTVSTGIISGFRESEIRSGQDMQISAPITSGSSGGALFDMQGEVVGITYAGRDGAANINFAIPVNETVQLMNSGTLKSFADVEKEVYPKMPYQEFSQMLKNGFSHYSTDGYTLKIDSISISEDSSSPDNVYLFLIMYRDSNLDLKNYLHRYNEKAKIKIEDWILTIAEESARHYSSKVISGGLWYIDEFSYYPIGYPKQDVSYDAEKNVWRLSHQEIFFSNSSTVKDFTILWQ